MDDPMPPPDEPGVVRVGVRSSSTTEGVPSLGLLHNVIFFKMLMDTPMRRLIDSFCSRQGLAACDVRFYYTRAARTSQRRRGADGAAAAAAAAAPREATRTLRRSDTPRSLGMPPRGDFFEVAPTRARAAGQPGVAPQNARAPTRDAFQRLAQVLGRERLVPSPPPEPEALN